MKSLTQKVITFAGNEANLASYKMFQDYWNHFRSLNDRNHNYDFSKVRADGTTISFSEKEEQMNAALRREILRVAGVNNFESLPVEQWITNPMVKWATFAVVNQLIDMILPETLIQSIGLYTDIRAIDWGDSAAFDIKPRDLFVVSKAGRSMKSAEVHKQFSGQVTVTPIMRELTVEVSLYKVLAGKESLGEFVSKAVRSLETEMTRDAFATFNVAMGNLSNAGDSKLLYAGYDQANLIHLAQVVSAWNGGQKAIIVGTPVALLSVLPNDANFRYTLESDYVRIGYINTMAQYDIMALPQVADFSSPFKLMLDDTRIYVVSPSASKIVKMVLEGSVLSNVDQPLDKANLVQDATLLKSWGTAVATNAVAGLMTLP